MSNCQCNNNGNSSFAINESRWRRSFNSTCASPTNWPSSLNCLWRNVCCNASNLRVCLACARNVKRKTSPHDSSAAETSGRLIARLQTITHTSSSSSSSSIFYVVSRRWQSLSNSNPAHPPVVLVVLAVLVVVLRARHYEKQN